MPRLSVMPQWISLVCNMIISLPAANTATGSNSVTSIASAALYSFFRFLVILFVLSEIQGRIFYGKSIFIV